MSNLQSVLTFNGTSSYISVPDSPSLQILAYTVEVWLKPNGKPNEDWKGIVGKPGRNFNIWINNAGFIHHRFHTKSKTNAGAPNTPNGSLRWDQWNHVAITNDGKIAKTYINGNLEAQGTTGEALIVDQTNLYIGRRLDGEDRQYFKGQIADIRIWNQVRSQDEIKQSMNRRLTGNEAGLVGYWPLNEGEGNTTKDRTDNNNNGQIIEAVWEEMELPIEEIPAVAEPHTKQSPANGDNEPMTNAVDLVIVIDTSLSMKDEATELSQAAAEAIEAVKSSCPCNLRVEWFGIEGRWKNTKFERRIRDYLLTECSISESNIRARKRGELKDAGAQEDAARTIEDISNHFNWREGAAKAIFYLGDEALEAGGEQTTEEDIAAANQAIAAAKANEVILHTYFGKSNSKYRDTIVSEYARLATETAGQAFTAQDSLQGFQEVLKTVICNSQTEGSSTTIEDKIDNSKEQSSPETVESSVLAFDGKDDYLEIPYQPQLSPNQFTLSCWAKVTGKQKQWRSPVTCRTGGPAGGYILYAGTNNKWQFWTGNGQKWVTLTGSNIVLRSWTHLAATYDGAKMTLYINGEQVGTPVESKINLNQRFPLRIGAGCTEKSPNYFFLGQIAEVRLWNQVRSSAEIKQFMNRRLTGNEAGLVGYWPLNEGSGTTIKDLTGNSQEAEIIGATWKQVKIPLGESPEITILWQIGKPQGVGKPRVGGSEFPQSGGWTPEYNYEVGKDADPINQPSLPGIITAPGSRKNYRKAATEKLNIQFTLERDYAQEELTLFYDRYGAEENSLFLDGRLLAKIPGKGEGKLQQSQIKLGAISQGQHTVTITALADQKAPDKAHKIDYFKLQAITKVESSKPEQTEAPSPETTESEPVETPVVTQPETGQTSSDTKVAETVEESPTQQLPQSKILSIDGGGIRGIIPAMILAEIEKRTQKPIHSLFDLIAGTSTGGLLALGLTKPSSQPDESGQPTAQYSAEELVEMYVEYGGLIFYESLFGKILGPIEDIFAQPKFSSQAKDEVMTKYFGHTPLVQCLKEVFVVSYDLQKRIPVFFTSNLAKQQTESGQFRKLCTGFTLKDAAMATSATPTYFSPYHVYASSNNSGCYTLVDGGMVANNPAHLAMMEGGVAEGKKQNDTLLLSLGTGSLTSVYKYEDVKNWGLLQWTIPLLNIAFDSNSALVSKELERLLEPARAGHPGSYYRFQTSLTEELEAIDNTMLRNIKGLQDLANQLIKEKTQEIDQLCELL